MKVYAIRDEDMEVDNLVGYLLCYEKAGEYIVELREDLDEWQAPLLFQKFVHEKKFTIQREAAGLWVKSRVIPSGRQNIGAILRQEKLKEYNELDLLALSKGRCAQDACYIEEILYNEIPDVIRKRAEKNVTECFAVEGQNVICFFGDNLQQKVSLQKLSGKFPDLKHVLRNPELLRTVKVGAGGYCISFHQTIDIPVESLRNPEYAEAVTADDFYKFLENDVAGTTEACEKMQCSRQNIAYLINRGRLVPIRQRMKEKVFTLGNIERIMTE